MRPTNVRASVGSSASGSSASPTTSVPPFLICPDFAPAPAPIATTSANAATACNGGRPKARVLLIPCPLLEIRLPRDGKEVSLDWIHYRVNWIQSVVSSNRADAAGESRPSTYGPTGRRPLDPQLVAIGARRRAPLGAARGRRRRGHGAVARAVGGVRPAGRPCDLDRRDHSDLDRGDPHLRHRRRSGSARRRPRRGPSSERESAPPGSPGSTSGSCERLRRLPPSRRGDYGHPRDDRASRS